MAAADDDAPNEGVSENLLPARPGEEELAPVEATRLETRDRWFGNDASPSWVNGAIWRLNARRSR